MKKTPKLAKQASDRISEGISSGNIILKNINIFSKCRAFFKNRIILNQTESIFIDFKRKTFPEIARNQYHKVYEAVKRKDKIDLMRVVSIPYYDIFRICFKEKRDIPFTLYQDVLDVKLLQARIYSNDRHGTNPNQTWHQMTMTFTCKDQITNQEVQQINVFERRESDPSITDWRICHIE